MAAALSSRSTYARLSGSFPMAWTRLKTAAARSSSTRRRPQGGGAAELGTSAFSARHPKASAPPGRRHVGLLGDVVPVQLLYLAAAHIARSPADGRPLELQVPCIMHRSNGCWGFLYICICLCLSHWYCILGTANFTSRTKDKTTPRGACCLTESVNRRKSPLTLISTVPPDPVILLLHCLLTLAA